MHSHYKIYKPYGCLSQFKSNDSKQKSKRFLGELYNFPNQTMAIGRLDEKSEGLLLLTTDGKLSSYINSTKIDKEYYVLVDGAITASAIDKLSKGVEIGINGQKIITKPCKARILVVEPQLPQRSKKIRDIRHGPISWISIVLNEGKFRQVRKMTSAVGFPTLRLVRVRIGDVALENMQVGDVIPLKKITS